MKSRWMIPAGVLDAGLASLATFGIGLFAIRVFEPALLGAYALVFAAFNFAVILPRELVFVPAEIAAVSYPSDARLSLVPRTVSLGLLPALLAAVLVSGWSIAAPAAVSAEAILAFTATAGACAFLSPLQDHLRRMLHIGGRSWLASWVSMVQLSVTAASVILFLYIDIPVVWIPFGSLAVANLASLIVGGVLLGVSHSRPADVGPHLSLGAMVRSGRWLLFGGLLAPGSIFVASVLVTHLAGPEALGFAEAARVIARPLPVLAMGISAVLRPMSIEAAQNNQIDKARQASRLYLRLMGACGLLYLIVAGGSVAWNPLAMLLPNAYGITGLAAATIISETFSVILFAYRYELLGGGRVVALTVIEGVGAVVRCIGTVATAALLLSFTMPLGQMLVAAVRGVGYRHYLAKLYRREDSSGTALHRVDDEPGLVRL